MSDNKKRQLGMNPSTASARLVKDLLWNFVETTGQSACCKCGEPMSRETFSIEHVAPWLDSDDPVGLYFDLGNISYSHLRCNIADARKTRAVCGTETNYNRGCRCDPCRSARSERSTREYDPDKRRKIYEERGY